MSKEQNVFAYLIGDDIRDFEGSTCLQEMSSREDVCLRLTSSKKYEKSFWINWSIV